MSKIINTGIIGFGLSGRVFHAPFIHSHPGFHLIKINERHHHHSKEIYPYVKVVRDHKELLADRSIDLIIVATPNIYHYPMSRECLLAGKHVVIEKPFTPSSGEAEELIRLSGETGKKIFVYQNRRWDGDFLTIRKLISEGVLGKIKHYEAHFDRYSPEIKHDAWRDRDLPGGGILFDLGAHLIDQALYLFGYPEGVLADIRYERDGSPVDDYFDLKLLYHDKEIVLKAGMMVSDPGPRFIVKGTKAIFTKYGIDTQEALLKTGEMPVSNNWGKENSRFWGKLESLQGPSPEISHVATENGDYMGFYNNVYEVLTQNFSILVSPEEARDVIFIIEKAFESNRKKQTIKLNKNL